MTEPAQPPNPKPIRWWPGIRISLIAIAAIVWAETRSDWAFQKRNLITYEILIVAVIGLVVWWTFLSRAPTRLRLTVTLGLFFMGAICAALFRLRGMSGDMLPIVEFRWTQHEPAFSSSASLVNSNSTLQLINGASAASFPQFLGPDRNGVISGTSLETNWFAQPPEVLWRQKVGAAWSGFSVVGNICITQEQRGDDECVVARELKTGNLLWTHADKSVYNSVIAGEGPRATPTIVSNRVFTSGGTGRLNCLDLVTGNVIWTRDLISESGGQIPQWGYTGSPLLVDELVIVHGGEHAARSLFAFRAEDGKPVWSAGTSSPSYASPSIATLAGEPQILAFNDGNISSHDPVSGKLLWERPWGNGNVVCASPVIVGTNQVLFSSGYGVGAELLEILREGTNRFSARLVWKSIRMKSKFAHMFARTGYLYGLDDGMFACVDLRDGSQRWKEGRYGHGQGLLIGDDYLLMSESGELVLLHPTPEAPNETARFRVFNSKTWNPIALAGDLLLVRNDQEAACLQLKPSH